MKCHYCDKTHDLRPYGPKGAMVCFRCAMSTPEREAETARNFAVQLDAAGPVVLLDGTERGPYPAKHAKVPNSEVTRPARSDGPVSEANEG